MLKNKRIKIGIIGCGAIGKGVSLFIDKRLKEEALVYALCDRDPLTISKLQRQLRKPAKIYDIDTLIKKVDLVIETASVEAAQIILKKILIYKKDAVILSVGALINNLDILKKANREKIKIYIPSGAICGVDGIGALSLGSIKMISLITSKPPRGLMGASYLKKKKIDLSKLKKERIIFQGNVKEAIKYFPRNINVAATLLLASSLANIRVCIKANPKIKNNIHQIIIKAKEAQVSINIENMPSKSNPKTSALTILSTQYLLKNIFSPFKIGS
ncbi:MAG: DUF108 domain-containing protein [Candidatus Omnitrophica bacterium]|jgi:aspartate dehydrogenase|nr:DUF108 domain-containing protein [Candidatus Omnitrophota bacterium]